MNPFLNDTSQPYGSIPFNLIKPEHFLPAIKHYVEVTENNISKIIENDQVNFENTILALEYASEGLDEVVTVFRHLFGSEADDEIRELIKSINPITTKLYNDIYLNEDLFKKIKVVYANKEDYSGDDIRLLDEVYNSFVRSGANLDSESKERYREISEKLSSLSPKFSNNVLNATNEINDYYIDNEDNLAGIPKNLINNAKLRANEKDKSNSWCFSLDTDFFILMKFCENRMIRKDIMYKSQSKCNGGKFDNSDILKEISALRHERANILGYDSHADYVLDRRMAKSKQTVYSFIDDLIVPSYNASLKEMNEISMFAKEIDNLDKVESFDVMYYGEKYKQKLYDFNDELLRPYFKSENVINGAFKVAEKLYGLHFELLEEVQVWHKEVSVYKVIDSKDNYIGLLYQDIHPRSTKRGGAWMNQLKSQGSSSSGMQEPHVTFNCNLTRASKDKPALLSISEVRTIFHEFGHCLHGLLTDVKYKSLGAMGVYWDFVELPSQILENWLSEKEVLNIFAEHYETGEKIPVDYIDKINESKKFMSGTFSLRQLHLCKIDMSWHDGLKDVDKIEDYEKDILDKYTVVKKLDGVAISTAFSHIFSGGYSAGYYSYKWAELLEADAFAKFKNEGIFNKNTALSFKDNILSKGNTDHPMNLFEKFMGRKPKVDALLEKGGLTKI